MRNGSAVRSRGRRRHDATRDVLGKERTRENPVNGAPRVSSAKQEERERECSAEELIQQTKPLRVDRYPIRKIGQAETDQQSE